MRKIILPPILLLACLIGMIALKKIGYATPVIASTFKSAGFLIIAVGIALPVWSAQIFKRIETNIIPYKSPDKIVTEGPFKFSRNPMYLGMLLVLVGTAVRLGTAESLVFVVLFYSVANWWYIPFEEVKMKNVFGDQFTDYAERVRRWI